MDVDAHLVVLAREGPQLSSSARLGGLSAKIPACPGWTVRDLLRHVGRVHRRTSGVVRIASPEPTDIDLAADPPPERDAELFAWFDRGHAALVEALRAAPPDLSCWTFKGDPAARHFWARRAAHETSIHRADADATADRFSTYDQEVAVDGIDELLLDFVPEPRPALILDEPATILVQANDADVAWLVTLGAGTPESERVTSRVENPTMTIDGRASDLYLAVWNRSTDGIRVSGDGELFDFWRTGMTI